MKKLFIDISIIEAFFNKNNKKYNKAINFVHMLDNQNQYDLYINLLDLTSFVHNFAKKINSAKNKKLLPSEYQIEKMILNKLNSFLSHLQIRNLSINSFDTLKRAEFYQEKYQISYKTAINYTIMKQNKIDCIISLNKSYSDLISEGLVNTPNFE